MGADYYRKMAIAGIDGDSEPGVVTSLALLYVGDQLAALNQTLHELSFEHTSSSSARLGRSLRVRATTYRG